MQRGRPDFYDEPRAGGHGWNPSPPPFEREVYQQDDHRNRDGRWPSRIQRPVEDLISSEDVDLRQFQNPSGPDSFRGNLEPHDFDVSDEREDTRISEFGRQTNVFRPDAEITRVQRGRYDQPTHDSPYSTRATQHGPVREEIVFNDLDLRFMSKPISPQYRERREHRSDSREDRFSDRNIQNPDPYRSIDDEQADVERQRFFLQQETGPPEHLDFRNEERLSPITSSPRFDDMSPRRDISPDWNNARRGGIPHSRDYISPPRDEFDKLYEQADTGRKDRSGYNELSDGDIQWQEFEVEKDRPQYQTLSDEEIQWTEYEDYRGSNMARQNQSTDRFDILFDGSEDQNQQMYERMSPSPPPRQVIEDSRYQKNDYQTQSVSSDSLKGYAIEKPRARSSQKKSDIPKLSFKVKAAGKQPTLKPVNEPAFNMDDESDGMDEDAQRSRGSGDQKFVSSRHDIAEESQSSRTGTTSNRKRSLSPSERSRSAQSRPRRAVSPRDRRQRSPSPRRRRTRSPSPRGGRRRRSPARGDRRSRSISPTRRRYRSPSPRGRRRRSPSPYRRRRRSRSPRRSSRRHRSSRSPLSDSQRAQREVFDQYRALENKYPDILGGLEDRSPSLSDISDISDGSSSLASVEGLESSTPWPEVDPGWGPTAKQTKPSSDPTALVDSFSAKSHQPISSQYKSFISDVLMAIQPKEAQPTFVSSDKASVQEYDPTNPSISTPRAAPAESSYNPFCPLCCDQLEGVQRLPMANMKPLKDHVFSYHLPWYIAVSQYNTCNENGNDFRRTSLADQLHPVVHNSVKTLTLLPPLFSHAWGKLLQGFLAHLAEKFALRSPYQLEGEIVRQKLYPSSNIISDISLKLTDEEKIMMNAHQSFLSDGMRLLEVSPPNCLSAVLHWITLVNVMCKLPKEDQAIFATYSGHTTKELYELEEIPSGVPYNPNILMNFWNNTTKQHKEVFETILRHREILNEVHESGVGPVHFALKKKFYLAARAMLCLGADPDLKDNKGWSPICRLAYDGDVEAVQILLAWGAKDQIPKALAIAQGEKHSQVIKLLKRVLKDGDEPKPKPQPKDRETSKPHKSEHSRLGPMAKKFELKEKRKAEKGSIRKWTCELCNRVVEDDSDSDKDHIMTKHLPWYLSINRTQYTASNLYRVLRPALQSFTQHKQVPFEFFAKLWGKLLHDFLNELSSCLKLDCSSDMVWYATANKLIPEKPVELKPVERLMMKSHQHFIAEETVEVQIDPPNCLSAMLHWEILRKLLGKVSKDDREMLTKLNEFKSIRSLKKDVYPKGFRATMGQSTSVLKQQFWDSIQHGNLTLLWKVVLENEEFVYLHAPEETFSCPVECAISCGHPNAARLLLFYGAPTSRKNKKEHTPLGTAALEDSTPAVRLLLPWVPTKDKVEAFNLADIFNNKPLIKLIKTSIKEDEEIAMLQRRATREDRSSKRRASRDSRSPPVTRKRQAVGPSPSVGAQAPVSYMYTPMSAPPPGYRQPMPGHMMMTSRPGMPPGMPYRPAMPPGPMLFRPHYNPYGPTVILGPPRLIGPPRPPGGYLPPMPHPVRTNPMQQLLGPHMKQTIITPASTALATSTSQSSSTKQPEVKKPEQKQTAVNDKKLNALAKSATKNTTDARTNLVTVSRLTLPVKATSSSSVPQTSVQSNVPKPSDSGLLNDRISLHTKCPLCAAPQDGPLTMKRHAVVQHLPWYFAMKFYKDKDVKMTKLGLKFVPVLADSFTVHVNNMPFGLFCKLLGKLLHGFLEALKRGLRLKKTSELLQYVEKEKLYPHKATETQPDEKIIIRCHREFLGDKTSTITISPPNCLSAVLHWTTITNIMAKLPKTAWSSLRTYEKFTATNIIEKKKTEENIVGESTLDHMQKAIRESKMFILWKILNHYPEAAQAKFTTLSGITALELAVCLNKWDIATMLLFYGAHPDHTNEAGLAPLPVVAKKGNLAAVKFLISWEASVQIQEAHEEAHKQGHKEISQLINKKFPNVFTHVPSDKPVEVRADDVAQKNVAKMNIVLKSTASKGKPCTICGKAKGYTITHVTQTHLPWYAGLPCTVDLSPDLKTQSVLCMRIMKALRLTRNKKTLPRCLLVIFGKLLHDMLDFITDKLELSSQEELLKHTIDNSLWMNAATGGLGRNTMDLYIVPALQAYTETSEAVTYSPPNCVAALLYWETLNNLVTQLPKDAQESIVKLETFNWCPENPSLPSLKGPVSQPVNQPDAKVIEEIDEKIIQHFVRVCIGGGDCSAMVQALEENPALLSYRHPPLMTGLVSYVAVFSKTQGINARALLLKIIILLGGDVEGADKNGMTGMHHAAGRNDWFALSHLLLWGASWLIQSGDGTRPVDLVQNNPECARLIELAGQGEWKAIANFGTGDKIRMNKIKSMQKYADHTGENYDNEEERCLLCDTGHFTEEHVLINHLPWYAGLQKSVTHPEPDPRKTNLWMTFFNGINWGSVQKESLPKPLKIIIGSLLHDMLDFIASQLKLSCHASLLKYAISCKLMCTPPDIPDPIHSEVIVSSYVVYKGDKVTPAQTSALSALLYYKTLTKLISKLTKESQEEVVTLEKFHWSKSKPYLPTTSGPKLQPATNLKTANRVDLDTQTAFKSLVTAGSTNKVYELVENYPELVNLVCPPQMRGIIAHAMMCEPTPGQWDTVKVLLLSGANVDAVDNKGRTALHNAVMWNRRQSVAYLLLWGASTSVKTTDGSTALDVARKLGQSEIVAVFETWKSGDFEGVATATCGDITSAADTTDTTSFGPGKDSGNTGSVLIEKAASSASKPTVTVVNEGAHLTYVKQKEDDIRWKCPICEESTSTGRQHALWKHLPWYISLSKQHQRFISGQRKTKMATLMVNSMIVAQTKLAYAKPGLDEEDNSVPCFATFLGELQENLLLYIADNLGLANTGELLEFTRLHKLGPNPGAALLAADEYCIRSFQTYVRDEDLGVRICPPSHVSGLLHWETLCNLIAKLPSNAQEKILTYEKFDPPDVECKIRTVETENGQEIKMSLPATGNIPEAEKLDFTRALCKSNLPMICRSLDKYKRLAYLPIDKLNNSPPMWYTLAANQYLVPPVLYLYGACPNQVDGSGNSPLHNAVNKGDLKAVQLLLSTSPNIKLRDPQGQTPLDIAKKKSLMKITSLVEDEHQLQMKKMEAMKDTGNVVDLTAEDEEKQLVVEQGIQETQEEIGEASATKVVPDAPVIDLTEISDQSESTLTQTDNSKAEENTSKTEENTPTGSLKTSPAKSGRRISDKGFIVLSQEGSMSPISDTSLELADESLDLEEISDDDQRNEEEEQEEEMEIIDFDSLVVLEEVGGSDDEAD